MSTTHASDPTELGQSAEVATENTAANYTVEQCQAITARIVAVSLGAAGLSQRAAASQCGVSRTLVEAWTNPDALRSIPLSRVLVLATVSRRGRDAARAILTAALSHVEAETGDQRADLRDNVLALSAEAGEVAIAVRESIADGVVDADERRKIAAELRDVERVCERMRLALAQMPTEN